MINMIYTVKYKFIMLASNLCFIILNYYKFNVVELTNYYNYQK